jgi:hypothetical protein
MPVKSNVARIAFALPLTVPLLTSGCANMTAHSATSDTICRELRRDLPTSSTQDTERSKAENADFRDVFKAVCG